MWVSKNRFHVLEKRIADLEEQVQNQRVYLEKLADDIRASVNTSTITFTDNLNILKRELAELIVGPEK